MRMMARLTKERAMSKYSSRNSVAKRSSDTAVRRGWNLSMTSTHFDMCISSDENGDSEMTDWQVCPGL